MDGIFFGWHIQNIHISYGIFRKNMLLLQKLKSALIGSQLILCTINKNNREFIKEKLLPFFGCCKRYKFIIDLKQKEISAYLVSLLQLPSIGSSVGIEFNDKQSASRRGRPPVGVTLLPIESLLTWLHKESNKAIGEKRSLRINLWNIGNISEMIEHLKKVVTFLPFKMPPIINQSCFCL